MDSARVAPEAVIEEAVARTGLDGLGSPHFQQFLEAWCTDLASDRLSGAGRTALARQAGRNIEMRLRILEAIRANPEIEEVRLPPVVRIMGFPRSGTTLLHNLMSLHPRARPLLRWELVSPLPPPEAETYATDPRIAKVQRPLEALRGTAIESMHWVEATDPEECTWGFFDVSGLVGRGLVAAMPEWAGVVVDPGARHRETYEEYRLLVQLLLWRNPVPADGVLILKCPSDNDQIQTFLDVFPEAKVLLCHRDPFRTLTSTCRIQEVVHGPYLADLSTVQVGAGGGPNLRVHRHFADGMVAGAADLPERIVSVRYADLMADPSEVTVAAFQDLSIDVEAPQMQQAVASFVAEQRRGRRAAPPADYDTYGYSASEIRSDPSLAEYIETFGVPSEDARISAPADRPASL
jgi:hypothetical protein